MVKAGLDVAQMWLDGDETLVNTIDRNGDMLPITMVNGHAITHDPLVVIVSTNFSCLKILTLAFSSTIFELATKKVGISVREWLLFFLYCMILVYILSMFPLWKTNTKRF